MSLAQFTGNIDTRNKLKGRVEELRVDGDIKTPITLADPLYAPIRNMAQWESTNSWNLDGAGLNPALQVWKFRVTLYGQMCTLSWNDIVSTTNPTGGALTSQYICALANTDGRIPRPFNAQANDYATTIVGAVSGLSTTPALINLQLVIEGSPLLNPRMYINLRGTGANFSVPASPGTITFQSGSVSYFVGPWPQA